MLNARANAAALAGGNGHLVSNPVSALLNQENNSNINNTADVPTSIQNSLQNPLLKNGLLQTGVFITWNFESVWILLNQFEIFVKLI